MRHLGVPAVPPPEEGRRRRLQRHVQQSFQIQNPGSPRSERHGQGTYRAKRQKHTTHPGAVEHADHF